MNVISIGEILWDVVGEAEHLGGAPLNFAANIARLGHTAYMVSAVAGDARGDRAIEALRTLGLSTELIRFGAKYPTGHVTVELDPEGQPNFTIHRPAAYDELRLTEAVLKQLLSLKPDWIYFGTLAQTSPMVRNATRDIVGSVAKAKRFYDVNLRPRCFDRNTVVDLLGLADVVKLNDAEVATVTELAGMRTPNTIHSFCTELANRFDLTAVCVTRAAEGCALLLNDEYIEAPGYRVNVVDAIGAGDAFAAGLLHGISSGWDVRRVADFANRMGALIASRAGAIPHWTLSDLESLSTRATKS